ncbi:MAG: hypothetical protein RQ875_01610 [Vicingaceae bacterium]|nr:hypothetical protein [Vicingaceae bacterium]
MSEKEKQILKVILKLLKTTVILFTRHSRATGEKKTIALVVGIYESEISADSSLTFLQKTEKKAFKIKTDMYIG